MPAPIPTRLLPVIAAAIPVGPPLLVAGDGAAAAARALVDAGVVVAGIWARRAEANASGASAGAVRGGGLDPSPWPAAGPYGTALMMLPRAKPELEMALHAVAGVLAAGGRLLVVGPNDAGIRSAPGRIAPLFRPVETLATAGHARLLAANRPDGITGLRGALDDWRTSVMLDVGSGPRPFVSWPGLFADGRLDPGSALLIEALRGGPLKKLAAGDRVLDYGCGVGILAAAVRDAVAEVKLDALDADTLALKATAEAVPGVRTLLGTGLDDADGAYRLIVSNPPIHVGRKEDIGVLKALVAGAPRRLTRRGELMLVTQKRIPLDRIVDASGIEPIAEDKLYRVWRLEKR